MGLGHCIPGMCATRAAIHKTLAPTFPVRMPIMRLTYTCVYVCVHNWPMTMQSATGHRAWHTNSRTANGIKMKHASTKVNWKASRKTECQRKWKRKTGPESKQSPPTGSVSITTKHTHPDTDTNTDTDTKTEAHRNREATKLQPIFIAAKTKGAAYYHKMALAWGGAASFGRGGAISASICAKRTFSHKRHNKW